MSKTVFIESFELKFYFNNSSYDIIFINPMLSGFSGLEQMNHETISKHFQ
jgi:hypothetical protein